MLNRLGKVVWVALTIYGGKRSRCGPSLKHAMDLSILNGSPMLASLQI